MRTRTSAYSEGYAGLAAAVIECAVLDARGRNAPNRGRGRTPERARRARQMEATQRQRSAKEWLAGDNALVSVHVCCDGIGLDYDYLRSRLEAEDVLS